VINKQYLKKTTFFVPIGCLLCDAAVRFPNRPGVINYNRILNYSTLNIEAQRLGYKLVASGVRPGDRAALHMYNGPELVVSHFACFIAGAIAVSVNAQAQRQLELLGQSELFRAIDDLRPRLPGVQWFVIDGGGLGPWPPIVAELPAIAADQPAAILYISGATARPKGVVHTHRSLLNAFEALRQLRLALAGGGEPIDGSGIEAVSLGAGAQPGNRVLHRSTAWTRLS
jgi:acyl-CoA synthetase (AMP-forming)/AMP-acid ligase II